VDQLLSQVAYQGVVGKHLLTVEPAGRVGTCKMEELCCGRRHVYVVQILWISYFLTMHILTFLYLSSK